VAPPSPTHVTRSRNTGAFRLKLSPHLPHAHNTPGQIAATLMHPFPSTTPGRALAALCTRYFSKTRHTRPIPTDRYNSPTTSTSSLLKKSKATRDTPLRSSTCRPLKTIGSKPPSQKTCPFLTAHNISLLPTLRPLLHSFCNCTKPRVTTLIPSPDSATLLQLSADRAGSSRSPALICQTILYTARLPPRPFCPEAPMTC
jgi:hypothetical protein